MSEVKIKISKEEILKVSRELEVHHAIFYKLWEIGAPVLNENIKTACVCFDKSGSLLSFEFNPKLWDSLTDYERAFVISHECLHIMLNHGKRMSNLKNNESDISNVAMDVAVNEMLLSGFGFKLNKLGNCPKLCLCNTTFKGKGISKDKSFEYYLNLLRKDNPEGMSSLDDHSFLPSIDKKVLDQIADQLLKDPSLSQEEIEKFLEVIGEQGNEQGDEQENNQEPGDISGKLWQSIQKKKVKADKQKWLNLVAKLGRSVIKKGMKSDEQWLTKPRRMSSFDPDFFLPFEQEEIFYEKNRFNTWFFLDCSGSCYDYASKFFNATSAVPEEHFDTRIFTFDTQVKEVEKEDNELFGFGGTSFSCLEKYIQSQILKNKIKYPDLIFILTDGYGDMVVPQYPKRWIWINTTKTDGNIPKDSSIVRYQDLIFD